MRQCPCSVIARRAKKQPEMEALANWLIMQVSDGAVGVDMGRNIFQSDSPVGMIQSGKARSSMDGKSADESL